MVHRKLLDHILKNLPLGKAIIILGPRQSGKTTLLKTLQSITEKKTLFLNCDEPDIRKQLTEVTSSQLKKLIGDAELLLIDEAQRIPNIGLTLKLIYDQIESVQIVATGSSAFELASTVNEPLTGRKFEYLLLPFSTDEMIGHHGILEETRLLSHRLVFGMYPDVVNNPGHEMEILKNLSSSYLYKDIFAFQEIRRPDLIEKLLEALALQVASQVSFEELAQLLKVDHTTVTRYIRLLEQAFIIFRLRAFSRNLRNELKKSRKIYFYDNGIRNAIIANFNPVEIRDDVGKLWENFLISERIKIEQYSGRMVNRYFWRTHQQQEIDYIEEYGGKLYAYEFKWNPNKKYRIPKTFVNAYPESETKIMTRENYLDFITINQS